MSKAMTQQSLWREQGCHGTDTEEQSPGCDCLSPCPRSLRPGREAPWQGRPPSELRGQRKGRREDQLGSNAGRSLWAWGSQEPSAPQGAGSQQASPVQLHHKATFFCVFLGFFCLFFFSFFFFSNISKEESKGRCVFFLKSFSVVVLEGFVGRLFFFFLCHFFPREKEEKSSFSKVLSLQAMGIPGAAGAPSTQARVQVPASLPTSHPRRKESQRAYPRQRSFG